MACKDTLLNAGYVVPISLVVGLIVVAVLVSWGEIVSPDLQNKERKSPSIPSERLRKTPHEHEESLARGLVVFRPKRQQLPEAKQTTILFLPSFFHPISRPHIHTSRSRPQLPQKEEHCKFFQCRVANELARDQSFRDDMRRPLASGQIGIAEIQLPNDLHR